MKRGKEVKSNKFKNYNVVFGTINSRVPKAIYITLSTWVEPKNDEEINYHRVIRNIDKKIRQSIFNYLSENKGVAFDKNNVIVDFDFRESGVKFNKRSFVNLEVTLFQICDNLLKLDVL